jgi:hypothetical protein
MIAELLWGIDFVSSHIKDGKYEREIIQNGIKNFVMMHC